MTGLTIAEKILARAGGVGIVRPGEIVEIAPDFCYSHDYAAWAIDAFEKMGATRVVSPSRITVCFDHGIPPNTARDANNLAKVRNFARQHGFAELYELGTGIAHQVMVEEGWILPGELAVANDSHASSGGCLGGLSLAVGETEIGFLWATGKLWLRVPQTTRVILTGRLSHGVYAKDLMLTIARRIGVLGALYEMLEFHGPGAHGFSISERFTLCNMVAEVGAKGGVFPFDGVTKAYLNGRARRPFDALVADSDATYARDIGFDLDEITPMVALPGREDSAVSVDEAGGRRVDQIFIGSCTNARSDDLAVAASILRGRSIHPSVRLIVVPASRSTLLESMRNGDIEALVAAGATLMPSGCAVCAGTHQGVLADGEVCLSTSNRNMPGRMGNAGSAIYLCSPATAAASAVEGVITDPRRYLPKIDQVRVS